MYSYTSTRSSRLSWLDYDTRPHLDCYPGDLGHYRPREHLVQLEICYSITGLAHNEFAGRSPLARHLPDHLILDLFAIAKHPPLIP
jgi:hypothetical protein